VFDSAQWVSPEAVEPLVRIDVTPADFPLLETVVEHRGRDPWALIYVRTVGRNRQRSARR
jgi:hypothetical protein